MTISNHPNTVNFLAYRGDTFRADLDLYECGTTTPIEIEPDAVDMHLYRCGEKKAEASLGHGISIENGQLIIQIQTADLVCAVYDYDVQFTFPEGVVSTFFRGKFTLSKDITI